MGAAAAGFRELRLDGVTRRFGDATALDRLTLSIEGGEFIALLGPSGCGKSTALNCLAGLLPLSGGSVWLDERRIDGVAPEERRFGMVFQSYALFPHLSVRRNVAFGLEMLRAPKQQVRRQVDEALALVRLTEHADKYPAQLSGGQQQRVAIARAVVIAPTLVLMDEPLSSLDAKLRLEMRTEIRRLHQTLGLTTVYVTHDQQEALSLADRIVVLRDGRVQQVGRPDEVYAQPANRYVADFMGYRNMLHLDVERADGTHAVLTGMGLRLHGRSQEQLTGPTAVAAVRPEDFVVGDAGDNSIDVRVEVVEYRGRERAVEAVTSTGGTLVFQTTERLAPGDSARISVPPDRVLVFAANGDEPPPEPAG
jgi:putative spermidine/putrescine transport system ATP-binding protein